MSYLGNTPTTQSFIAGTDTFSGTGSQTAFTLSRSVNSVNDILVVVNNVDQQPTAYTAAGTGLVFSAAPSSGTNNIYVRYLTTTLQSIAPSQGTITPTAVSDQLNTSTGYFNLPAGTTAQRPASPVVGMIRYNTTESKYEVYINSTWKYLASTSYSYNIEYLVVAGGGAGGYSGNGGGGGAGGFRTATGFSLDVGTTYTVTIGAGGTSVAATSSTNGANSVFSTITSTGGGAGGPNGVSGAGNSGGSGGGGLNDSTSYAGGSGTSGQGNAGGASGGGGAPYPAGGGGGASAVGTGGTSGGQGGAGTASSITGSSVTYAGGGGGARSSGSASAGGVGGGGAGGVASAGVAGTANTGGGGGGSGSGAGSQGGSGVVILSIPTANYSGTITGSPTVTTSGSNTILKFTGSGSYAA